MTASRITYQENVSLHRDRIVALLESRGLLNPRIPASGPAYAPELNEILVTTGRGVDLMDIARVRQEIEDLLGADVRLVPDRSERGRAAASSALSL